MANIGSFKKVGLEYQGEIVSLGVQAKNVRIVPEDNRQNENAPTHRIFVGRAEIGAAWTKRSASACRSGAGEGRARAGPSSQSMISSGSSMVPGWDMGRVSGRGQSRASDVRRFQDGEPILLAAEQAQNGDVVAALRVDDQVALIRMDADRRIELAMLASQSRHGGDHPVDADEIIHIAIGLRDGPSLDREAPDIVEIGQSGRSQPIPGSLTRRHAAGASDA